MDVAVYGFQNTNKNEQTIIAIFPKKGSELIYSSVNWNDIDLHGDDLLAIKMISHIHMHCIGNMGSIETPSNGIKRKFSQIQ
ncbi:hypothetical protein T4C_8159 [Trichinella pseudospiralis]|uniref:Uncharacterized protein n=1 Tax=Trichinella pseudospiralis TaxID=6337 RepID=A0A0V1KBF7_TRIPS|nr:hypothetical protein T4C_8159 [Trichinella pseudospiralis]